MEVVLSRFPTKILISLEYQGDMTEI